MELEIFPRFICTMDANQIHIIPELLTKAYINKVCIYTMHGIFISLRRKGKLNLSLQ